MDSMKYATRVAIVVPSEHLHKACHCGDHATFVPIATCAPLSPGVPLCYGRRVDRRATGRPDGLRRIVATGRACRFAALAAGRHAAI